MYRSWIAPAEPSVQGPCALLKFGRWIRRRLPVHTIPGMDVSGAASTFRLRWGERFPLLVLDEVHHLADTAAGDVRGWHDALRIAPSPHRLALTATYPDNHDTELSPTRRRSGVSPHDRRDDGSRAGELRARAAVRSAHVRRGRTLRALTDVYENQMAAGGYRERGATPADAGARRIASSAQPASPFMIASSAARVRRMREYSFGVTPVAARNRRCRSRIEAPAVRATSATGRCPRASTIARTHA